jgi:hypothetical protein
MDLGLVYMDGNLRHKPKTFMRVKDSKGRFQVQIVATKEKSESVLQPRHFSVFSPYNEF